MHRSVVSRRVGASSPADGFVVGAKLLRIGGWDSQHTARVGKGQNLLDGSGKWCGFGTVGGEEASGGGRHVVLGKKATAWLKVKVGVDTPIAVPLQTTFCHEAGKLDQGAAVRIENRLRAARVPPGEPTIL